MSNPPKPNSPNPPLFTSCRSTNQNLSIPMRIQAFLSTSPSNSTSSALFTSSTPSPSTNSNSRCEGLDLLTMAVLEVDGDRAFEFQETTINGIEDDNEEKKNEAEVGLKPQRRRRQKAMPSKYRDSVLQPWKRRTRRSVEKKVKF